MTKKMLKRKDFIKHLSEFEGIDLNITGDDNEEFSQYDGGCNIGKLSLNARVVKLLERLELYQKIQPERVYIEMPLGATRGDVLITCESDIRMGTLRKMRNERIVERAKTLCGFRVNRPFTPREGDVSFNASGFQPTITYVFEGYMVSCGDTAMGPAFRISKDMRDVLYFGGRMLPNTLVTEAVAEIDGKVFSAGGIIYREYSSLSS